MVSYLAPKLRNRKDAQEQIIRPTESLSKPARAHSGTFLEPYPDPPYWKASRRAPAFMRKEKWTAREAAEMKASDERDKLDEQDGVHSFMSRPTCVKGWQETEEQAWASKTDYNPPRPLARRFIHICRGSSRLNILLYISPVIRVKMQLKIKLNDSAAFKEAVKNSNSKDEIVLNRAYSFVPQGSPG